MQIKIEDATIRQNIEFFLEILRRAQKKSKREDVDEAIYKACVHRETGQLFFDEMRTPAATPLQEREWKPIVIHYEFNPLEGEMRFEIDEAEHQYSQFKTGDLSPAACRIVFQTLKTLNNLCQRLKGPSEQEAKISVLTRLKIETGIPDLDRNLVISAWHQVDRSSAEELLWEKPLGTYLFRKDEYARILEDRLQEELQCEIKCITLTFNAAKRKISDLTLVHQGASWLVYNDDPSLELRRFPDLNQLLRFLGPELKYPLFH